MDFLLGSAPLARLSASFSHQTNIEYAHTAIHSLAHIVNSEEGNRYCGQSFHFNAGSTDGFRYGLAVHHQLVRMQCKVDSNMGQGQRMAQRNQIGCAFCTHDSSQSSDREYIPFFLPARRDRLKGVFGHADTTGRHRDASRFLLRRNPDHMRLAGIVKMGKFIAQFSELQFEALIIR